MTDINSLNAVDQERARIREEVVKLNSVVNDHIFGGATLVRREDVLKIIRNIVGMIVSVVLVVPFI